MTPVWDTNRQDFVTFANHFATSVSEVLHKLGLAK